MDHVTDVTPHELQHAAVPNDTVDALTGKNLLSLAVLTNFIRHSESYGQTLTKLVKQAGTQGERTISAAYNVLINDGYLCRVEFGYERPAGDTGRSGRRATRQFVSRVPMTAETFEKVVQQYRPGRYVLTPISTGATDDNGREVYEMRRVKVLSAEVYCHRGALRIDREGLLSEHAKRRGGSAKKPRAGRAESTPADPADSPEPANAGSGESSTDEVFSQVAPEPAFPDSGNAGSINKKNQEHEEDEGAAALADARLAPGQTPAPPRFTPDEADGGTPEVGTTDSFYVGDHLNAREDAGSSTMTRTQAQAVIREAIRKAA